MAESLMLKETSPTQFYQFAMKSVLVYWIANILR